MRCDAMRQRSGQAGGRADGRAVAQLPTRNVDWRGAATARWPRFNAHSTSRAAFRVGFDNRVQSTRWEAISVRADEERRPAALHSRAIWFAFDATADAPRRDLN